MAEKNSRRNETTDALFDAILSLESREECYAFFEDLCTVKEISDMCGLTPCEGKTMCPDNTPAQTDLSAYEIVSE